MTYTINKSKKLQKAELKELFSNCFSKSVPEKYFEWKYKNSPDGEVVKTEAWKDDHLIGFYGLLPEKYYFGNDVKPVYQSMDTMTHSAHSGKGIFTKLAKQTYDDVLQSSSNLNVLAFVGANSFYGFKNKLNFVDLGKISKIYAFKSYFKLKKIFSNIRHADFECVTIFDEKIDEYFELRSRIYLIEKIVNKDYLNWRIFDNPVLNYRVNYVSIEKKIIGYFVYRLIDKQNASLEYIDFLDQKYFPYITNVIDYIFRASNVSVIETFSPGNLEINNEFVKCGFLRNPFSRGPYNWTANFIFHSFGEKINPSLFKIENFNLQPLVRD